jgi:hypothetical protein
MISPQFFAAAPLFSHAQDAMHAFNGLAGARRRSRRLPGTGGRAMQTGNGNNGAAIGARVWREFGQLALEGLAIGLVFSVLVAAAVFMMARTSHGEDFASARTPAAEDIALAAN